MSSALRAPRAIIAGRVSAVVRTRQLHVCAALSRASAVKGAIVGASAAALLLGAAGSSLASTDKIGEFAASGFIFKDMVEVEAIDDDDVPGITIYISDFKRSITDKLSKDFFSEPSQASVTCVQSGVLGPLDASRLGGREGREVFSERKGLSIFKDKTLRVRRIYDEDRRVLTYVAYRTSMTSATDEGGVSTGRYRTSLCAIPIPAPAPALS